MMTCDERQMVLPSIPVIVEGENVITSRTRRLNVEMDSVTHDVRERTTVFWPFLDA